MRREVELRRHLHSLTGLREAVTAMKSLSAHHFRVAREAVKPARSYRESVERMLGWTEASLAGGDGHAGLLVLGGELGLCGSYNTQLVEEAVRCRRDLGPGPTLCVGHRAASLLGRRGIELTGTYAAPSSVQKLAGLLLPLGDDVFSRIRTEHLSQFQIVSSRFGGTGVIRPERLRLIPISVPRTPAPKRSRYVAPEHLAWAVIRESIFITLSDLLIDTLASEHGARLLASQLAERWLDERTTQLRRRLAAARRESITQEMVEIAAGARLRRFNPALAETLTGTDIERRSTR